MTMQAPADGGRRKLLIVANLFHATPRIPRLVRHLPSSGWTPTIITPVIDPALKDLLNAPPEDIKDYGVRIIETGESHPYERAKEGAASGQAGKLRRTIGKVNPEPDSKLSALMEKYYWRLYATAHYPDVERAWKRDALDAAESLLKNERFDVMLSSSSPIITHVVCAELKRRHGIPWIAEYRDLWTQNHNYLLGPVMKRFDRRLELRTVGLADAIVTNTDPMKEELQRLFPPEKCFTVTTGYEKEDYSEQVPLTRDFTITYTGQFYRPGQDPSILLDAVAELIKEKKVDGSKARIRFYGPRDDALQRYADALGLGEAFSQHGVISKEESVRRQKESQLLLCLNWGGPKGSRVQPIKFVDYLATERPILVTGGDEQSYIVDVIRRTDAGAWARSKEELKAAVEGCYRDYLARGSVPYRGKAAEIGKLDIRVSARRYADIMERVRAK